MNRCHRRKVGYFRRKKDYAPIEDREDIETRCAVCTMERFIERQQGSNQSKRPPLPEPNLFKDGVGMYDFHGE